jgi:hypothetical protein
MKLAEQRPLTEEAVRKAFFVYQRDRCYVEWDPQHPGTVKTVMIIVDVFPMPGAPTTKPVIERADELRHALEEQFKDIAQQYHCNLEIQVYYP